MEYVVRSGKYERQRGDDLVTAGHGNMPKWAASDPANFWRAADENERANGSTYREIQVALPRELDPAAAHRLARGFIDAHLGAKYPFSFAIHSPKAADGKPQPHMHLMFSERALDGVDRGREHFFKRANRKAPAKGGAAKTYNPAATPTARRESLKALRAGWGEMATQALAEAGHSIIVDLRSNVALGISAEPERKHSPSEWRNGGREAMVKSRTQFAEADRQIAVAEAQENEATAVRIVAEAEAVQEIKERQRRDDEAAEARRATQASREAQERAARRLLMSSQPRVPDPRVAAAKAAVKATSPEPLAKPAPAPWRLEHASDREKPLVALLLRFIEKRQRREPNTAQQEALLGAVVRALGKVIVIAVSKIADRLEALRHDPVHGILVAKTREMIRRWEIPDPEMDRRLRQEGHLAGPDTPAQPAKPRSPKPRRGRDGFEL